MTENVESQQKPRRAKVDINLPVSQIVIATVVVTATAIMTKGTLEVVADLTRRPVIKLTDKLRKKANKLEEENKKA